jgi:hypothetical protein
MACQGDNCAKLRGKAANVPLGSSGDAVGGGEKAGNSAWLAEYASRLEEGMACEGDFSAGPHGVAADGSGEPTGSSGDAGGGNPQRGRQKRFTGTVAAAEDGGASPRSQRHAADHAAPACLTCDTTYDSSQGAPPPFKYRRVARTLDSASVLPINETAAAPTQMPPTPAAGQSTAEPVLPYNPGADGDGGQKAGGDGDVGRGGGTGVHACVEGLPAVVDVGTAGVERIEGMEPWGGSRDSVGVLGGDDQAVMSWAACWAGGWADWCADRMDGAEEWGDGCMG